MLAPKPLEAKNKVQITKHLEVEDMVIIGSKNVDDKAFYVAQEIILKITSKRPEIRTELIGFVMYSCCTRGKCCSLFGIG